VDGYGGIGKEREGWEGERRSRERGGRARLGYVSRGRPPSS